MQPPLYLQLQPYRLLLIVKLLLLPLTSLLLQHPYLPLQLAIPLAYLLISRYLISYNSPYPLLYSPSPPQPQPHPSPTSPSTPQSPPSSISTPPTATPTTSIFTSARLAVMSPTMTSPTTTFITYHFYHIIHSISLTDS
jgi:hypothetical protein